MLYVITLMEVLIRLLDTARCRIDERVGEILLLVFRHSWIETGLIISRLEILPDRIEMLLHEIEISISEKILISDESIWKTLSLLVRMRGEMERDQSLWGNQLVDGD